MKPDLWHFTDAGHADAIGAAGVLVPACRLPGAPPDLHRHSTFGPIAGFVWLTDLAEPTAAAIGLARVVLPYDRMEVRYRVTDCSGCVPWHRMRRTVPPELRRRLEAAPGAAPARWWVSRRPVSVVLAPRRAP